MSKIIRYWKIYAACAAFFLFGDVSGSCGELSNGRFLALCIGLRYPGAPNELNFTTNDVRVVSDALVTISGFDRGQCRVDLLVDDDPAKVKPTSREIRRRLTEMAESAGGEDRLVFYFSGHGILEDGQAVLLCHGGWDARDGSRHLYLSEVREILSGSRAARKLVIVDACHSGGKSGTVNGGVTAEGVAMAMAAADKGSDAFPVAWLVSCDANEKSWEDDETGHGLFTRYFLEAVGSKAELADTNYDGQLSLAEIHKFITTGIGYFIYDKSIMKQNRIWRSRRQTPRMGLGKTILHDSADLNRFNMFYYKSGDVWESSPEATVKMNHIDEKDKTPPAARRSEMKPDPFESDVSLEDIRIAVGERREYAEAARRLSLFIEKNHGKPVVAEALVLLGYCHDKQKDNQLASEAYMRSLREYPNASEAVFVDAALGAADALFRQRRYQEAAVHYSMVIARSSHPKKLEAALMWRGKANYLMGISATAQDKTAHFEAAVQDFTNFIAKYPDSDQLPAAVSEVAFSQFDLGKYDEALVGFQSFRDRFSDDHRRAECDYFMAESLYRLKRYNEAGLVYLSILEEFPENRYAALAKVGVAWVAYQYRDVKGAAEGFEIAAQLPGLSAEEASDIRYDAACAWREAKDIRKAVSLYEEIANSGAGKTRGLAWFRLGQMWKQRDASSADAIKCYRMALALGGLGALESEAQSRLAELLAANGQNDEADSIRARMAPLATPSWKLDKKTRRRRQVSAVPEL